MKSKIAVLFLLMFLLVGCGNTEPAPTDPTDPVDPADPTDPVDPADPSDPTDPTDPVDPTDTDVFPREKVDAFMAGLGLVDVVVPAFEGGKDFDTIDFGSFLYVSSVFATDDQAGANATLAAYTAKLDADEDWVCDGLDESKNEYVAHNLKYTSVVLTYSIGEVRNYKGDKELLGYSFDLYVEIEAPTSVVTDTFPTKEIQTFFKQNRLPSFEFPSFAAESYIVSLVDEKDTDHYGIRIEAIYANKAAADAVNVDYFNKLVAAGWYADEYCLTEFDMIVGGGYYNAINFSSTIKEEKDGTVSFKFEILLDNEGLVESFPEAHVLDYIYNLGFDDIESIPSFDADMYRFSEENSFDGDYALVLGYFDTDEDTRGAAAELAFANALKEAGFTVDDSEAEENSYYAYLVKNSLEFNFSYHQGKFYFYIYDATSQYYGDDAVETFDKAVVGETSIIDFETKDELIAYQPTYAIWNNGAFSLKVEVADSDKPIGGDEDKPHLNDPLRIMPDQKVTISSTVAFNKIEFECPNGIINNYAKNLGGCDFGTADVKVDRPMVVITLPTPVTSLTFTIVKQARLETVKLTFAQAN